MYRQMMARITSDIENQLLDELEIPQDVLGEVSDLVGHIDGLLADSSYDRLVHQIMQRDWALSNQSPAGESINVIPGQEKVACSRVTLAVSTGFSAASSIGFPRVMRSVREYLIDCQRMAKAVVLLTDTWSPRHIDEHIGDIQAHARNGRYVIPYLVTGGRILRVDWPRRPRS
jgi:hypothetical protein